MFMVLITIVTGASKPTYNWGHHIVYIYSILHAWSTFLKNVIIFEECIVWFCATSPWYKWDIFFKWEAVSWTQSSKWRLGWSRGIVHMSHKSNPCFFIGRLCCRTRQKIVVRGEKAFFNTAQFQTNCAHEINALCQYYCKLCISVGFSKKGYGSFESPKGHGVFFIGTFDIS